MDRFTKHIMPQVPGCPKAVIEAEVLRAAITFCSDSWIWQSKLEETVLSGDDEIPISIPRNSMMVGVYIAIDGREVNTYTLDGLAAILDDAVTADTLFEITVFLAPSRAAVELPDILYNEWFTGIESGARALLMVMPEKPWSNPQLALANQQQMFVELGKAKMKARRINDQSRLRVQRRPFV